MQHVTLPYHMHDKVVFPIRSKILKPGFRVFLLVLDVGIFHYHLVFTQFKQFFFVGAKATWQIWTNVWLQLKTLSNFAIHNTLPKEKTLIFKYVKKWGLQLSAQISNVYLTLLLEYIYIIKNIIFLASKIFHLTQMWHLFHTFYLNIS